MSEKLMNCLLTNHLQGVYVYIATHHPALRVELGAAEADRHADFSVLVASDRQSTLTLEAAGRPAAGANTTVSAPEKLLNNAEVLSMKHEWLIARTDPRINTGNSKGKEQQTSSAESDWQASVSFNQSVNLPSVYFPNNQVREW